MDAEKFEKVKREAEAGYGTVPADVLALCAEVERLSAIVEKHIDPKQVMLTGLNIHQGSFDIGLEGGPVRIFAAAFADYFKDSPASNYIEMQLCSTDLAIGELIAILQRKQGKTPHQCRLEAERERDAARAEAERLRQSGSAHADALQRAGTAVGLLAGDDLHRDLVPAIAVLRDDAERWRIISSTLPDDELQDIAITVAADHGIDVANGYSRSAADLLDAARAKGGA